MRNPDPALTPNGMQQARATGKFLKHYFEENGYKFDKIIIECSPFLKCMMTAGQIIKILQGSSEEEDVLDDDTAALNQKEIHINYRATQVLDQFTTTSMIPNRDPMPHLELIKNEILFQYENEQYFPKNVQFLEPDAPADYKDQIFKAFPES